MDINIDTLGRQSYNILAEREEITPINVKNIIREYIADNIKNTSLNVNFYDVNNVGRYNVGKKSKELFILNDATIQKYINEYTEDTEFGQIRTNVGGEVLYSSKEGNIIAEYVDSIDGDECNVIFIYANLLESLEKLEILNIILEKYKEVVVKEEEARSDWENGEGKKELTSKIQTVLSKGYQRELEDNKRRQSRLEDRINNDRRELLQSYRQLEELRVLSKGYTELDDKMVEKIIKDLDLVSKLDKIRKISVTEQSIEFETKELVIYDGEDMYYGGRYKININISDGDIKIYSDTKRQGYWSSEDPHPHVSGRTGIACFGSIGSTLVELLAQREFYALTLSLIDFLENVNTSDAAGENVVNWEKL